MQKQKLHIKQMKYPQRWKVVCKYTYPLFFCNLSPDGTVPLIIAVAMFIIGIAIFFFQ